MTGIVERGAFGPGGIEDPSAVVDRTDAAAGVERKRARDRPAVDDPPDRPAVEKPARRTADQPFVDHRADPSIVVQASREDGRKVDQAAAVVDRIDRTRIEEADPSRDRARIVDPTDRSEITHAVQAAVDPAGVGESPELSRFGDIRCSRDAGNRPLVGEVGERRSDIVVGDRQQQVDIAADRADIGRDRQPGDSRGGGYALIGGTSAGPDQRPAARADEIGPGTVELVGRDHPAADVRDTADQQRRHPERKRPGRLRVIAGDVDRVRQPERRAGVDQRACPQHDRIVEQDFAGSEDHVAYRVADQALAVRAVSPEHADAAARPAGEDEIRRTAIDDSARNRTAVRDRADRAVGVERNRPGDQAGVAQDTDRSAVDDCADLPGSGIELAVDQRTAVHDRLDRSVIVDRRRSCRVQHAAVGEQPEPVGVDDPGRADVDDAGIRDRVDRAQIDEPDLPHETPAIGERAERAARCNEGSDLYREIARVGDRSQRPADIIIGDIEVQRVARRTARQQQATDV